MEVFTVKITNIHCEDCHKAITNALSKIFNINDSNSDLPKATIKIIDDEEVSIAAELISKRLQRVIISRLENLGFIVDDYSINKINGEIENNYLLDFIEFFKKRTNLIHSNDENHLKNCSKCQVDHQKSLEFEDSVELQPVNNNNLQYRAIFQINELNESSFNIINDLILKSLSKYTTDDLNSKFTIDLSLNTVSVLLPNKQLANQLIQSIKKSGFNSVHILEILPVTQEINYRINAAIGGISCAACASSISNAIKDLPFLVEHSISIVSKSGIFIINDNSNENINKLKETIEDCGFDFNVVDIKEINHTTIKKLSRSVNLKINGMFCEHCPVTILNILKNHGDAIIIDDPITLNHPFIKFNYIPSVPNLTIRSILKEIESNSRFKVEIIKDISLDDQLRKISKLETLKIVYRLILTTILTIPTFIIGIVGMSFLKKDSKFKMWLDKPLWTGNTSTMTWILFFLSTPVYFFAADIFHVKALKEIRTLWKKNVPWKRRLFRFGSMNLLMSLGTSVSYFASIALLVLSSKTSASMDHENAFTTTYFDSVVFLTFFLLIGRLLESYSKTKTAEAISSLGSLKPNFANLIDEDLNENKIEIDLLEIGDLIKVLPGESPPVDCIIQQGTSDFDESALTGESIPVEHTIGEQIFAGTINKGPSSVIAKISTLDGTSLIDQIVSTVRDGQMKRAPIERSADVLTGIFVPIITLIAILTWVIWISLGYSGVLPEHYLTNDIGGWAVWSLEFAIAVFVIACPCGIGLAAPTALFVGAGLAAKNGILARGGGIAFEEGSKINIICFDKTGTLTMGGDLRVTNFSVVKDLKLFKIILQLTKDLEINSNHPLSVAVKNFIDDISVKNKIKLGNIKVPEAKEIPGKGLIGEIIIDTDEEKDPIWSELNPEFVILGNEALMKDYNVHFTSNQQNMLNNWKLQGKSIIIVSLKFKNTEKFQPILLMASRDEIRPEAKNVIKILKDDGIKIFMISGDNYLTANSIAKELGIDNVIAEVLPEEKAEKIKFIRSTHKNSTIAMVGDGINDAPALAVSDVGIALSSGSDLALTSSDFVLLSQTFPLISLLTLLKLTKKVFKRVKFNFGWALVYNMIGIPIAAGVIYPYKNSKLSPVWASAAMALSSISVVLSSLALKFFKKPKVVLEEINRVKNFEAIEEDF